MFDQTDFDVRCEWGQQGVARLAPICDAIIIVDVLSFSTCVDVAVGRGASIFPYRYRDERAVEYAESIGAVLASRRDDAKYSLSPQSMMMIPAGIRLVLPSPNGSTLSLGTGKTPTFAGCLRNYQAVAEAAQGFGTKIGVVPAGERWKDNGSLRPSFEDWVGAGAIISQLGGSWSAEARAAVSVFRDAEADMEMLLRQCGSGKELIEKGFAENVAIAAGLDVSNCVPLLIDGAYQNMRNT